VLCGGSGGEEPDRSRLEHGCLDQTQMRNWSDFARITKRHDQVRCRRSTNPDRAAGWVY